MLYRGRLQLEGRVSDLLEVGEITEVSVKGLSEAGVHAVEAAVKAQGGTLVDTHRRRERLETLFMRVVEREREKSTK
jgi:hypothetical protein